MLPNISTLSLWNAWYRYAVQMVHSRHRWVKGEVKKAACLGKAPFIFPFIQGRRGMASVGKPRNTTTLTAAPTPNHPTIAQCLPPAPLHLLMRCESGWGKHGCAFRKGISNNLLPLLKMESMIRLPFCVFRAPLYIKNA